MPYPEHKTLPPDWETFKKTLHQKRIESSPYVMCSFYEGFHVIQIQGKKSKEYFFGSYFNGKYCGHIYMGSKYSQLDAAKICEYYMPKQFSEIDEYSEKHEENMWYFVPPMSQYAWIFNRVLTKI